MDAAISAVIESFDYGNGHRFSDIDLKRPDMRCGFVFRYAAHGAALVRCRILEGVRYCPELKSILKKNLLKVVSLGSGPGNDAIGFCSAMRRSNFSGTLEIVMTDAIPNWSEFVDITEQFLGQGDFGEASNLFLQGQVELFYGKREYILPDHLPGLGLLQFDIVLICKLLSIMNKRKTEIFPEVRFLFAIQI